MSFQKFTLLIAIVVAPCLAWAGGEQSVDHLAGSAFGGFYDSTNEKWLWQGPAILGATAAGSYLLYQFADTNVQGSEKGLWGDASHWVSFAGGYAPYALPIAFFGCE